MSALEHSLHMAAQPYLRPGEPMTGCGMVSRVVPMVARMVPLARVAYTGHFLVAVTPLRLLCFPVDLSFTGVPRAPTDDRLNIRTSTCNNGVCQITCQPAWGDCNNDVEDGCEEGISTTDHCGACGRAA